MGSYIRDLPNLHITTPCIPSHELSATAGCNIYLKLENLQPSGSFKSRGIGRLMSRSLQSSPTGRAHFYCSSGGNAGLACAEAGRTLQQPCDVFVHALTPSHVVAKLSALGATPHRIGTTFLEADARCREAAASDPEGVYVSPFDNPHIWDGAATLVDELAAGPEVDAIVCSVGGGGLLNGIMEGVERNYAAAARRRPTVLAIETAGADSLAASIRAGEHVTIPAITSVATSLGAPRVSAQTFRWAQTSGATTFVAGEEEAKLTAGEAKRPRLVSAVISDAEAVSACARFVDDTRFLVEVACGATVASAYNPSMLRAALAPGADDESWRRMNVVLVVCGGSSISVDMLAKYRAKFGV
ncbi:tryptophan synthase beta subunit-like PLP-dependent enzyme [Xylaria telfairii]|nr:tryptophan synthase beta subunit-like PLP-dependent enzyme [Xylaria telfairii]